MKGFNMLLVVILMSFLMFTGCDDSGSSSGDSNAVLMTAIVENIPGSSSAIIILNRSNVPVNDAIVVVNGTNCLLALAGSGMYMATGAAITTGTSVTITVTGANINISETLVMPEVPVVIAPTSAGGPYDSTQTFNTTWNAFTTNPDLVLIEVNEAFTVSTKDYSKNLAAGVTTHTIPADIIKTGQTDVQVSVVSVMLSLLSGDAYEADSLFMLGNVAKSGKFNTQ